MAPTAFPSSLAPWLSVCNGPEALIFYTTAFDATEVYRLPTEDGSVVARLSVQGAEFWLSGESPGITAASSASPGNEQTLSANDAGPEILGGGSIRLILTVADPDTLFRQALSAGAIEVFPVGEDHGWRLGRLIDPFGLHWEIGRPLDE
jgi:PhnB protein